MSPRHRLPPSLHPFLAAFPSSCVGWTRERERDEDEDGDGDEQEDEDEDERDEGDKEAW